MPITVACRCGQRFAARDHLAGRQVKCPACGGPISISAPEPDPLADLSDDIFDLGSAASAEQSVRPAAGPLSGGYHQPAAASGGFDQKTLLMICGGIGGFVVLILIALIMFSGGSSDNDVAQYEPADSVGADAGNSAPTEPTTIDPGSSSEPARSTPPPEIEAPQSGEFGSGSASPSSPEPQPFGGNSAPVEPEVAEDKPPRTDAVFGSPTPSPRPATGSPPASGNSILEPGFPIAMNDWRSSGGTFLAGVRRAGDDPAVASHYSWMTELLPHLGYQEIYDKFDMSKSWHHRTNLQTCGYSIPEFLNPANDQKHWKGYPYENIALTHFVGVAGIEDSRNVVAAELPRSDPRAGVFGYQEVVTGDAIGDGQSNTMAIIGAGEMNGPWVQAGGATVRGAREPFFADITGFGSKGVSPKGAIVVMADGSVRTVSADIDPSVFRAMSTINGAETVDLEHNPAIRRP